LIAEYDIELCLKRDVKFMFMFASALQRVVQSGGIIALRHT
jgi:hypothetical protein